MADHDDDKIRDGIEHLQAAAREVIAATRSLLDAAEELLDDPRAVQDIVASVTSVAQAAAAHLRSSGASTVGGDGESQVQRIKVS